MSDPLRNDYGAPVRYIEIEVPVKIISEMNHGGRGWQGRHFRSRAQRDTVTMFLRGCGTQQAMRRLTGPLVVTLTRIAPRPLDSHDNLRAGFKHSADAIAEFLGRDDHDASLTWEYRQERGKVREYAIRIRIDAASNHPEVSNK